MIVFSAIFGISKNKVVGSQRFTIETLAFTVPKVVLTSDRIFNCADNLFHHSKMTDEDQKIIITVSTIPSGYENLVTLDVESVNPDDGDEGILQKKSDTEWHYLALLDDHTDKWPGDDTTRIWKVEIAPQINSVTAGEILKLNTYSVFKYCLEKETDRLMTLEYVKWKYANVIGQIYWSSVSPGSENATTLLNNVTIGDFQSENYCAGVLGHENVHCSQDVYIRWLGQGGAVTPSAVLYWQAVSEIPAYQWQLDNASGLGLTQDEINIVQGALDFFIQQMEDNE